MQPPISDGANDPGLELEQVEEKFLNTIEVLHFDASPSKVVPLAPAVLSWSIKAPTGTPSFAYSLMINDKVVQGLSGTTEFAWPFEPQFFFTAKTAAASRALGAATVDIDASQCWISPTGSIPATIIVIELQQKLDNALQGQVSGSGVDVVIGDGTISIAFSVDLNGSGTMYIASVVEPVVVSEKLAFQKTSATVSVSLTTDANVDSWCSNAMSEVVEPFWAHIVDNEIIPGLVKALCPKIDEQITTLEKQRSGTTYALTYVSLTKDAGFGFTLCPVPANVGSAGDAPP